MKCDTTHLFGIRLNAAASSERTSTIVNPPAPSAVTSLRSVVSQSCRRKLLVSHQYIWKCEVTSFAFQTLKSTSSIEIL